MNELPPPPPQRPATAATASSLARPRVPLIACGATMFLAADPAGGGMALRQAPEEIVGQVFTRRCAPPVVVWPVVSLLELRTGAELTWTKLIRIRDEALALAAGNAAGVALVLGTDTLDEAAFALHLLLEPQLHEQQRCLVITGAMRPADMPSSDGPASLAQALLLAADPSALETGAVLVAMNDHVHLGCRVQKGDSQLLDAFTSRPGGPIAQFRNGQPRWLARPLRSPLPDPAFGRVSADALEQLKVIVWTVGVSAYLPESLLQELDGLVLAAPGAGSLPSSLIEQLTGTDGGQQQPWTQQLPIVVVSRCGAGESSDDFNYAGSLAKYEMHGFILQKGYESLTPLQARLLLTLRLATTGGP